MDAIRVLLDRELVLSAVVHDIRGPLTALHGWADLAEDPTVEATLGRVSAMVEELVRPGPVQTGVFEGHAVRVTAPIDILRIAIHDLPHGAVTVHLEPEAVVVAIHGVPAAEAVGGWTLPQVREWLARGGPGLAGARLRIAARLCGVLGLGLAVGPGDAEGVATLRLARG